MATDLVIRLKKNSDGSASLSCTRSDGSVTWQRQDGKLGRIFPLHDLTHFAVETLLGYTNAFYGLVADGWDISDFTSPWPRGQPPTEARQVENIVSGFDMDRSQGIALTADDYNRRVRAFVESVGASPGKSVAPLRPLTDDEVRSIRDYRDRLINAWSALEPGKSMELTFDRRANAKGAGHSRV